MSTSGGPGGGEGAGCPLGQHQLQLQLLTALLPQAGLQVSIFFSAYQSHGSIIKETFEYQSFHLQWSSLAVGDMTHPESMMHFVKN